MKIIALSFLVIILSACATIMMGTKEEVAFTSETDSVEVWISGNKIGYTPTSVKLGKKHKNVITFVFPEGQTYSYELKTKISPTILYNLINIYNPPLAALGAGVDLFGGAGRTFYDRTISFSGSKTNNEWNVNIEKIRKYSGNYILCSGGLSYLFPQEINGIYIAETYFELMHSFSDIIHCGYGLNPGYFKAREESVLMVSMYLLFKVAPRIDNSPRRFYFIGHFGTNYFWTDRKEDNESFNINFYIAPGFGISFGEKIYIELLLKGIKPMLSDNFAPVLGFRVGYRLNLF